MKSHALVLLGLLRHAVAEQETHRGHFDFIEIGTSKFDTLIQQANGTSIGLSVEALKFYQDALPDPPGVKKVNAALVGNQSLGHLEIFYVDPVDIQKHALPDWLQGCNMVFAPHPAGLKELEKRGLAHLMRSTRVPALTFAALARQEEVRSIGFLKVDVEGQEPAILDSLFQAAVKSPSLWPSKIFYETQWMDQRDRHIWLRRLAAHGYVAVRDPTSGALPPKGNNALHLRVTPGNAAALAAALKIEHESTHACNATSTYGERRYPYEVVGPWEVH
jgi:hypothetical protein